MPDKDGTIDRISLSRYYNASQFRIDTWNELNIITQRLADGRGRKDDKKKARSFLDDLAPVEMYWAFPGDQAFQQLYQLLYDDDYAALASTVSRSVSGLMSGLYRRMHINLGLGSGADAAEPEDIPDTQDERMRRRPYFEVLIVDNISQGLQSHQRGELAAIRRDEDNYTYQPVFVPSFEDALIAVLLNVNIQAVVIRYDFQLRSKYQLPVLIRYLAQAGCSDIDDIEYQDFGPMLANVIARLRPEMDLYLITNRSVEDVAGRICDSCRRVFYNQEDYVELHLNILRGIEERFQTPFFTALKEYSKKPTGVFHALPISRGKSILKSNWIRDMGDFYGMNIFLAETSATSGGLDSLLEPHGSIKRAQELASRAFGSRLTYFATGGTSACNKIVVQALVRPGDIVLVDRDCHKSHHYGMVMSGAQVIYLDSYPLNEYSMYGAVPLREIKKTLLDLKRTGKIDRVRMLLLTNCTFDGIVYNVERVMEECLAIKPDLVFLWDEAWFGFARFAPTYRQRTAMSSAGNLRERMKSESYRREYEAYAGTFKDLDGADDEELLSRRLLPDPDKARIRVYATQSTHKTLTALRQGSMIHIHDQDYKSKSEEAFHEAFMTHTSTSPNYQILASLDVGRRQVELEGFELVQKQVEMAMALRQRVCTHPLLTKYFTVLTVGHMIPEEYRKSGIETYYEPDHGWNDIWDAWADDEFCLDASSVSVALVFTGLVGDSFMLLFMLD